MTEAKIKQKMSKIFSGKSGITFHSRSTVGVLFQKTACAVLLGQNFPLSLCLYILFTVG